MFWDRVAGVYDLFANIYNGKTHRELCQYIENMICADDEVLECACGTGMLSIHIASKCKTLLATDFSANMLKKASKKCDAFSNVRFQQADIMHLDYPDTSFDKVVAANVIHLLDDPYLALKELERLCRNGGKIIIPTYINLQNTNKSNPFSKVIKKAGANFKRQFTYLSYQQFFQEAGYPKAEYRMIEGRVPCAVATITKNK